MNNTSTPKWDVEVYSLYFGPTSLRATRIQVSARTGPEVDISWISSATVFLIYGQTLIGEATVERPIINIEDCNDILVLGMEEFEIQDMIAFKSLVRHIMPKSQDGSQPDNTAFTGELEIVDKGHKLTMTMRLHGIGSLETTEPMVQLTGDLIEINFSMWNPTPVEFYFEEPEFELQKDGSCLATLFGQFEINASDHGGPDNRYLWR